MDREDIRECLGEIRESSRKDPYSRDSSQMLQVRAITYLAHAVLEVAKAIREKEWNQYGTKRSSNSVT